MNTLIAFSLLVASAVADPQVISYGYNTFPYFNQGLGSVGVPLTYSSGLISNQVVSPLVKSGLISNQVVSPLVRSGLVQNQVVSPFVVAYPSQDTSRGIPQPVEDTPAVKYAKAIFAKQYENAAVAAALTPETRTKRDTVAVTTDSLTKAARGLYQPVYTQSLVNYPGYLSSVPSVVSPVVGVQSRISHPGISTTVVKQQPQLISQGIYGQQLYGQSLYNPISYYY